MSWKLVYLEFKASLGLILFFCLLGATWAFCPGVSILSSDLLSEDQLPLLIHSCCFLTFGLLLGSGQLVAHQHPGSVQQTGFLSQDRWIVSALNFFPL